MNLTSFIFFTLVALVGLWIASDYLPGLSAIFSSLLKPTSKAGNTDSKLTIANEDEQFVDLTRTYVKLRHQLKDTGNDVGVKQLDQLFQYLNQSLVKKV